MSEQRNSLEASKQQNARLPSVALLIIAALSVVAVGNGCARGSLLSQVTTSSYKPSNVYLEEPYFPADIKRVVVLPLTALADDAGTEFGREALGPLLLNELGRSRLFELVTVSPEELRLMTGRNSWTGEERLPNDFFETLKVKLGVDAVLFCRLTQYRAYEPLTVGWRLKLLETTEPHVVWALDEVFDARIPEVAAAARRFALQNPDTASSSPDSHAALVSPRRFGQYTANAVVQTLPGRREAVR